MTTLAARRPVHVACFCLLLLAALGCQQKPAPEPTPPAAVAATPAPTASATRTVLFLGNSLTAGYGLATPDSAFPALIGQQIAERGLPYRVVNAGLSGETTAGGLRRIGWLLRQPVDVLVIELGGNDGLRGLPVEATKQNLQSMIDSARALAPDAAVVLAGMQIPPNFGADYTARFKAIYPDLAQQNGVALIPFLLAGVGGIRSLNQPDGIHPTAAGHRIVARTVWKTLEPILSQRVAE